MSLWICPKDGTLTGPNPAPCPKCGGGTEYYGGNDPIKSYTIATTATTVVDIAQAARDANLRKSINDLMQYLDDEDLSVFWIRGQLTEFLAQ